MRVAVTATPTCGWVSDRATVPAVWACTGGCCVKARATATTMAAARARIAVFQTREHYGCGGAAFAPRRRRGGPGGSAWPLATVASRCFPEAAAPARRRAPPGRARRPDARPLNWRRQQPASLRSHSFRTSRRSFVVLVPLVVVRPRPPCRLPSTLLRSTLARLTWQTNPLSRIAQEGGSCSRIRRSLHR